MVFRFIRVSCVLIATVTAIGGLFVLFQGEWLTFLVALGLFVVVSIVGGFANMAVLNTETRAVAQLMFETEQDIQLGDFEAARDSSARALRIAERIAKEGGKSFDPGPPALAGARMQRAVVLFVLGDLMQARALISAALPTLERMARGNQGWSQNLSLARAIKEEIDSPYGTAADVLGLYSRGA